MLSDILPIKFLSEAHPSMYLNEIFPTKIVLYSDTIKYQIKVRSLICVYLTNCMYTNNNPYKEIWYEENLILSECSSHAHAKPLPLVP